MTLSIHRPERQVLRVSRLEFFTQPITTTTPVKTGFHRLRIGKAINDAILPLFLERGRQRRLGLRAKKLGHVALRRGLAQIHVVKFHQRVWQVFKKGHKQIVF